MDLKRQNTETEIRGSDTCATVIVKLRWVTSSKPQGFAEGHETHKGKDLFFECGSLLDLF